MAPAGIGSGLRVLWSGVLLVIGQFAEIYSPLLHQPLDLRVSHSTELSEEPGQGVGFLEDGTMVVVESGDRYLNRDMDVLVTRVLQTAAGCIIFAQPKRG